jgi:hypothetical protein
MRPFVTDTAIFRGHYATGFEEGRFWACGDTTAAWVRLAKDARSGTLRWPKPNDRHPPRYYVRWLAIRVGPDRYGHMGVASFEMTVLRVLEVRRSGRDDCR